jgi:hypothetical protein
MKCVVFFDRFVCRETTGVGSHQLLIAVVKQEPDCLAVYSFYRYHALLNSQNVKIEPVESEKALKFVINQGCLSTEHQSRSVGYYKSFTIVLLQLSYYL